LQRLGLYIQRLLQNIKKLLNLTILNIKVYKKFFRILDTKTKTKTIKDTKKSVNNSLKVFGLDSKKALLISK